MNNNDDKRIKELLKKNSSQIPEHTLHSINQALPHTKRLPILKYAIPVLVAIFVVLPNTNRSLAQSLMDIPVLGKIFEVTSLYSKQKETKNHKEDITVPHIKGQSKSITYINKDIKEWTNLAIKDYEKEAKNEFKDGYSDLKISYKVIRNTQKWFTLRVDITYVSGSSSEESRYYHIDKSTGKSIKLSQLFIKDFDYTTLITNSIKKQMKENMKKDSSLYYWDENKDEEKKDALKTIDKNQSFYFDHSDNLVICFKQFDIAPGYMGEPEFVINKDLYADKISIKGLY